MEFEKPKFGTKKWFENYWYHYKWHTIGGLFVLFLLAMLVHDMVSKEKYDAEISIHTSTIVIEEQRERLEQLIEPYAVDSDGDGTVNVGITANIFPGDDGNPQLFMAAQTKFMAEMSDGVAMILILDDYTYELIGENSFFADLSAINDQAQDGGMRVPLSATALGKDPLIAPVADKLFFTLRTHDSHIVTKNEKTEAYYQSQKQLLESILASH